MAPHGAPMPPLQQLTRRLGAQPVGLGDDPQPTEVQTIRVPAHLKGQFAFSMPVGVETACFVKQLKTAVAQVDQ
jgi:hypothetical protein